MLEGTNPALLLAAALNAIIGVIHLAIIAVGPRWYRLFGAGERMAVAAEKGRCYPALITAAIACVLLAWSAYALSAAGAIGRLPLLLPVICLITLVYLLRGLLGPVLLAGTGRSQRFIVVSSLICLGFGVVHLVGLVQQWPVLG
ncbi:MULTISPECIES: hypothetical protein [Pseudomonas]|uniref:Uncharacterized protein n=4 Tax=Pseudomonas TaxID=286 RepID=A0A140FVZ7_PSEPK|nr:MULTISPECIES: hypothetical protein [Pseudomonas]QNV64807.1 hypothetical protein F7661_01570 [Pseudomonas sp. CFA]AMM02780.1 conserved membrane protein of unknown function [Pseudomonas putida KT2440]KMU93890.1 hypothetical protein AC138_21960 [Pseudomonas putida]KMY36883.1 hypothetical protein AA993_03370 [Pseudomonas putida]MBI6884897.1 hypothetical protein [Pseudomonas putida]